MIYYTCKFAVELATLWGSTDICLSTDDDGIKSVVREFNMEGIYLDYERPQSLATDTAGKMGVIDHALNYMEHINKLTYDYIIDLDVTSPLRSLEDLNQAFRKLKESLTALNIFSVSPANRNPYFNMVEQKPDDKFVRLCKQGEFLTRQSAPKVYDVNASFYIYRKQFFEEKYKSAMTNKTLIFAMDHICFDLDHPIDFEFMIFLLENKKVGFDFLY